VLYLVSTSLCLTIMYALHLGHSFPLRSFMVSTCWELHSIGLMSCCNSSSIILIVRPIMHTHIHALGGSMIVNNRSFQFVCEGT
jgi:hypothetical protein